MTQNLLLQQLDTLIDQFTSELAVSLDPTSLQALKSKYVGPKGSVSALTKSLKELSMDEKRSFGARLNEVKADIETKIADQINAARQKQMLAALENEWIDTSLRESNLELGLKAGGIHPLSLVQREIEDVFTGMGFEILDGPYVETEYYNFEALNIPSDHPARDMQDTFWFPDIKHLLRTHTSAVQVRGMETHTPPFKFIVPGKVFRCERTDASHEMVFHQLEGMLVGENVSVANLIFFMNTILNQIFRREVKIRLRPGFFPFVEPGFELDIGCLICEGAGCSVCKRSGWLELLPCGMVHPKVLEMGGIDPNRFTGFAFGLGLDRLLMMRYGINDIRLIHSADLRFSAQFKNF